jgi:fructose-bisphosphate aldolase, class I
MSTDTLKKTAAMMVASGKGIIAADESASTCSKRFESVSLPCTEETRRAYRTMMFETPGLEAYVSGVILYDETIRQKGSDGTPVPQLLEKKGILPGIKVDAGAKDMALHPGEKITEGLDGLRERLAEYRSLGARFAKWRAVITIGEENGAMIPSEACIFSNAHALARYAALCQEADIVPMVEPEVLIDGEHSLERCYEVSEAVLESLFEELAHQSVALPGTILKASMVIAGKKAATQSSVNEVAEATVGLLTAVVPKDLAGVVFLSGGQGDEQATAHLDAMNRLQKLPWPLSFSYSRAIQNPVLKKWAENPEKNTGAAQEILLFRSKMCSLASTGMYESNLEDTRPY